MPGAWSKRIGRSALAVGVFLLSFLLAFALFFPVEPLKERLAGEVALRTDIRVEIGGLAPAFPPGLRLRDVLLRLPASGLEPLAIPSLDLAPAWGSLLGGRPALAVEGRLLGGKISGRFGREGSIEARLEGLEVGQVSPTGWPFGASGRLDGTLASDGSPLAENSRANLALSLKNAQITGLETVGLATGRLSLGTVSIKGAARGNRFRVEEFSARGGEAELAGRGTLLVGSGPAQSRLSVQVELRPAAGPAPGVRELLALSGVKAGGDGWYRFRVSGSLAAPVLVAGP